MGHGRHDITADQPLHFFFLRKYAMTPAIAPRTRMPLRQGDLEGHLVVHSDMVHSLIDRSVPDGNGTV
ncbi:hypothetical protein BGC31_12690 [Komagataeibacter xylinus]|nr:hypothetical protein BFX83_10550 [Komagataeibacter xylinus]RFP07004.1 hypothetical protein BGC31_12690 [Komagataeibacter xylinus]